MLLVLTMKFYLSNVFFFFIITSADIFLSVPYANLSFKFSPRSEMFSFHGTMHIGSSCRMQRDLR